MKAFVARFGRDRRGMAAVEFALLLPVMLTLSLGVVEVTNLVMAQRKLVAAAQTAADLIAQETDVTTAEVTDILEASKMVVRPLSTASLLIGIASVRYDDDSGAPYVDWTQGLNGGAVENAVDRATGLGQAGGGVVVVQATYNYTPIAGGLVLGSMSLSEVAISKPRTVDYVIKE
jgi:Flp pilus assembly protein TadG